MTLLLGLAACSSAGVHSNGAELPRAERDLRPVTSELMKALNRSPIHFVGGGGGMGLERDFNFVSETFKWSALQ